VVQLLSPPCRHGYSLMAHIALDILLYMHLSTNWRGCKATRQMSGSSAMTSLQGLTALALLVPRTRPVRRALERAVLATFGYLCALATLGSLASAACGTAAAAATAVVACTVTLSTELALLLTTQCTSSW
jgi:hypothetical protein